MGWPVAAALSLSTLATATCWGVRTDSVGPAFSTHATVSIGVGTVSGLQDKNTAQRSPLSTVFLRIHSVAHRYTGITYNALRVMEEVLAIKPDICFLWDEAWYAFATAVPFARQRTAMDAAAALHRRLTSPEYRAEYDAWRADMADVAESEWVKRRLLPDPDAARVRVYATHSTHKSLSALRQGSMIHVWDQDFDRFSREQFNEAYLTHTSTSPNQQLVASLDLARRQVDLEGYRMVRGAYQMALAFRQRMATDPLLGRWFRVLDVDDLVPAGFRPSGVTSYLPLANPDAADGHPE